MRAKNPTNFGKLHLGCGNRHILGFVHIDIQHYDHIDYVQDVRSLPMVPDNITELIYAAHVLEHFTRQEAPDILREWNRVLKSGGLLRLSVPNFAAIIKVYQEYGSIADIHGMLYGKWGVDNIGAWHRTVYDYISLSTLLLSSGFRSVRYWDWRKTEHAHIDDFSQAYWPHMDKENGILISLNVEATKW